MTYYTYDPVKYSRCLLVVGAGAFIAETDFLRNFLSMGSAFPHFARASTVQTHSSLPPEFIKVYAKRVWSFKAHLYLP